VNNRQLLWDAIVAVTGNEEFPFENDARLIDDIGLDSTSSLEVLMEIEDHSALEVDPNDLEIDDFQTVGSFIEFLNRSIPVRV